MLGSARQAERERADDDIRPLTGVFAVQAAGQPGQLSGDVEPTESRAEAGRWAQAAARLRAHRLQVAHETQARLEIGVRVLVAELVDGREVEFQVRRRGNGGQHVADPRADVREDEPGESEEGAYPAEQGPLIVGRCPVPDVAVRLRRPRAGSVAGIREVVESMKLRQAPGEMDVEAQSTFERHARVEVERGAVAPDAIADHSEVRRPDSDRTDGTVSRLDGSIECRRRSVRRGSGAWGGIGEDRRRAKQGTEGTGDEEADAHVDRDPSA